MKNFVLKGDICYSVSPTEMKTLSGYAVCMDSRCQGVFEILPAEYTCAHI